MISLQIKHITVIGAGLMGSGIAQVVKILSKYEVIKVQSEFN